MRRETSGRSLPALLLVTAATTAAFGGYLVTRSARLGDDAPTPGARTAPTPHRAPTAGGAATTLAPLGDGYAVASLGGQELALLQLEHDGKGSTALQLMTIYQLRRDPDRYPLHPEKRAPHGVYLDDLGARGRRALARDQAAFRALADARAVGTEDIRRLDVLAASLLRQGDATALRAALTHESYAARRAAALALGEAGFVFSAPVLGEVLEDDEGPMIERARRALRGLAGRELRTRADLELWWRGLPALERYRRRPPPERPVSRPASPGAAPRTPAPDPPGPPGPPAG